MSQRYAISARIHAWASVVLHPFAHVRAAHSAGLEQAAALLDDMVREHRERTGHVAGRHCEDFGCGDIEDLAQMIRDQQGAAMSIRIHTESV